MAVKSTLGVGQQSGVYYSEPKYKKTTPTPAPVSTVASVPTTTKTQLTPQEQTDYQKLAEKKVADQNTTRQTAAATSTVDDWFKRTEAVTPTTTYEPVVNDTPSYAPSVQQPVDSYNAILDTYKQQLAQQRDDYLSEIEARLAANKKAYEDQYGTIETQYATQRDRANQEYDAEVAKAQKLYDEQTTLANQEYNSKVAEANKLYEDQEYLTNQEYDAQRNQSEVNRYKTARAIREALANRGQLDSGLGRQETLQATLAYNNALNAINMNRAKALNDISTTRNTSLTNLGNTLSNALNNISSNRTQSLTSLGNTKNNALADINLNESKARDLIAQYLLQLEADAKKERASVQNNYSNSLLSLMANQL